MTVSELMNELDKILLCGPFILCVLSCVYDKWQSVFLLIPDESVVDKGPFNTTVIEGDNITLSCNATGNPTPNITWTKVGSLRVLYQGQTCSIYNIQRETAGDYACTAWNGIGKNLMLLPPSLYTVSGFLQFLFICSLCKLNSIQTRHFGFVMMAVWQMIYSLLDFQRRYYEVMWFFNRMYCI